MQSIGKHQQEYVESATSKLNTFHRTFPAFRLKLQKGQLKEALKIWKELEWHGLHIYMATPQWEAVSRTLSQIVAEPATQMTDAEVQQVEELASLAARHSPSGLISCMARRIRMKDPDAAIALYHRYSMGRTAPGDRVSDVSPAAPEASDLAEIKYPGRDPSDDRAYGVKLLAIAAYAASNLFAEARSLFITSYYLSSQPIPVSEQFIRSHLPNEDDLGKKISYYLQVFDLAHLIDRPSKLERDIEQLGQRQNIPPLEKMYSAIVSGLWGPWPWLAATPADVSPSRPVLMPEVGWSAFLFAFVLSGRPEHASRVWDDISASGATPGVACWTALIAAHAVSGNLDKCKQYLSAMKSQSVTPNAQTYRAIVSAAFAARQTREAMLYFAESQAKASVWTPAEQVSIYNAVILGLLLTARTEHKNEADARRIFDLMRKKGPKPDKITYNTMLTHFARRTDLRSAAEILRFMEQDNQQPDVYTFSTMLSALLKAGRPDAQDVMFRTMEAHGVKPNSATLTTIIADLIRNGGEDNVRQAFGMLQTMEASADKNIHPNEVTYTAIIKEVSRHADLSPTLRDEFVQHVVDRMERRQVVPNLTTLHYLIIASLGNPEKQGMHRALEYYKQMVERKMHMVPDSWFILISGMEKRGELGVARELIDDMSRSGLQPQGPLAGLVNRVLNQL
jgi:pentatricopeptide repeat protein